VNEASPPGKDARSGVSAADSAGLPWSGRELTSTGFEGDLGAADTSLLAALDDPQDETALMRAVARARLLVPIVAVPLEVDDSGEPVDEKSTHIKSTDMAVVTLTVGRPACLPGLQQPRHALGLGRQRPPVTGHQLAGRSGRGDRAL
jgi:hypothetical protein